MRQEVERLIKQGNRDLENAEKNIGIEAYEVAAFLAQQAVEKHLKAAWAHLKKERPPTTHYLRELGAGLRMPARLLRHLMFLTPDYTVARYPDAANGIPYELYDAELAREKVGAAREVIEWLAGRLGGRRSFGRRTSRG